MLIDTKTTGELYNILSEQGLYTKSFDEFKAKYSDTQSINKLHALMRRDGLYQGDNESFYQTYFADKNPYNIITSKEKEKETNVKIPPREEPSGFFNLGEFMYDAVTKPVETFQKTVETVKDKAYDAKKSVSREYNKLKFGDDFKEEVFEHNYDKENPIIGYFDSDKYDENIDIGKLEEDKRKFESKIRNFAEAELAQDMNNKVFKVIDDVEKSYAKRKKEQQDLIPQFFGKYENGVFVPGEYENLSENQKLEIDKMISGLSMVDRFMSTSVYNDLFGTTTDVKGYLINNSITSYNKKNGTNFKLKDLSSNEDFYNYVTKSYISLYSSSLDSRMERRKKKKVKEYLKEEGGDTFLGEGEERLTYKENAKKLADKYQPVYNELKKGADNLIARVESASYIAERESEWLNKNSPELVLARYKARKYYSQEDINNAQAEYTEYFNEYNSRLKNLQNQLIIAEELQNILRPSMEKILVLEDELRDIGIVGELAGTNYSWGSQLRTKITTGFYSTFIGMNEALKRYGALAQEDSLPGFLDDIKNGLVKAITPTALNNALTKKAADWYVDRSTDTDFTKGLKNLNDYVVSTQMDEKDMHWSLRTLGDMAQMAPQILLASTGVGTVGVLGTMSLSAAGNSFIDLEKKYMNDYAKLKGIDYSDVNPNSKEFKDLYNIKLYASATFHGSMEGISETVGGIFGSRAILKTLGGRIPTYGVKRYMGKTLGLATYVTAESGIEGFTEGLSTFSTNVFDKYVFNEKVDVWDGVSESFYRGALASGGYKAPLILKQTFTPFISNMTQENLAATAQRLREIDSQLLDVKLQADKKSQLIKEAERLVNANIDLYDKAIKSSASLTSQQRSDLIKIQTENYKITQKAREIKNSEKLSKNEKNLQLTSLKNQYSVNQGKKSDILKTLDKLTDTQKEKAWNTQVSIIRQNAKLAEQEGSKPINVIETNTDGMQQYFIDDAAADITQADAVVQSMRQVVKDKNSTREEKIEAQEILNEYKKQKPVNKYIQMIKGKASDYGMMVPKFNSKGEITSFDIVLNKQTSLEDGMLNTAAHEFLHVTFFNTLKQDPAAQRVLGDSLLNIIQNDADVTYTELGLNTINQRLQQYDVYGEEAFTVVSELMLENQVIFKETGLQKIAGVFRRFAQNHIGYDIKFDTEQDIKNFIIDYHKSIKNNKPNKAIARMIAKGAKGNLVAHAKTLQEREEQAKFVSSVRITNNNNPDLKNEFDDLVFKEDGLTPKFKNNQEFRLSPEYSKGYEKIMNTNLLNGLIQQGMIERGLPTEALMEFTRKVKEKISERYLKNYNVSKNDSLFGWLTGVSGGAGKSIIYRAKGDVIKEYVKERQADQLSIDRPVGEAGTLADVLEADVTQQQEFEKKDVSLAAKKTRKIVLADRLGVTKKVANAIEKIAPELDVEKLTFKTLKNKIPEITGELFGIAPKKLITNANITKGELQSSQMFISKNADLLIAMLPDGATASGTATGVPNTLLKAFYTKTDRTKMAKTGSKAGLAVQQKNNITKKQFLEVFGIVDGKPNRTDRNTSARVLSLANTLGKVMTNQAVRQELGKQGESAKQIIAKLKDGNSNIVFSKRLQKKAGSQKKTKIAQDLYKQIKSKNFEHGYISKIFGSNVLNSQQIMRPSGKTKILKTVTDRDLEGVYPGNTKESGADYRNRVANNFLKQFPQHREILRSTMAGGIGQSLFRTTGEFDLAVPETNVDQSSTKRFYPHESSKLKPNLLELLNKKEQKLNQKNKIPVFTQFLRDVQTYLTQNNNENILDVGFFEELIKDTQNNMGSVTRISAPYLSYPVKNGKLVKNEILIEEHSFPNIDMGRAGIFAAASGNVDAVIPIIEATYMQMSLLSKDNDIVNYMYSSTMPDVFYEQIIPRIQNGDLANLPAGYVAFVRYAAAKGKKGERINLNNYKLLDGQTVAQFFGVDGIVNPETGMPDIAAQNDTIIDQLTGKVAANFGKNISRVKLSKKADIHLKIQKLKTIARSKQNFDRFQAQKQKGKEFVKSIESQLKKDTSWYSRGMSAFDFDETLIDKGQNTIIATKGDDVVEISSGNWPLQGPELAKQGYEFDFSDFVNVKGGVAGPLMQKFKNRIAKYGIRNNYILTARPQESAPAIQAWLKTQGIDMPIENITGLGNSTGEAKALWIADKYAEGYNDIYFVDDALPNVEAVQNVLNQLDIKGKSVQAKIKFSKRIKNTLNKNKSYVKFKNSLKNSVFYHGGLSSLKNKNAVWFIADDVDGAKVYSNIRGVMGEIYSVKASQLKNSIIIPDVNDSIGFDKIIKQKFPDQVKALVDDTGGAYGKRVTIEKILKQDNAAEIISEYIDWADSNFELFEGVYGPATLYDNSGKISKSLPVIVLDTDVSSKVKEVKPSTKFSKSSLRGNKAVKNVFDQLDIKGKSVQAKIQSSKKIQDKIQPGKDIDGQFNKILEDVTGIDSKKRFSDIKARKRGASKGKFRFFIPPSHEDFVGLLYNFMGKGRVGDAHRDFFEQNLIRPLNRAYREIDTAKQAIANDYKSLNKEFKSVKDKLKKKTPDGDFTFEDAVRVYIWTKHNYEIPGLSQTDQTYLAELVSKDGELQAYAETINLISKQETYVDPGLNWEGGNIKTDLIDATGRVGRAEYFKEFAETSDIIFNEANLNKIEAAYGASFRSALEDMLHAIKTGINRPKGQSGTINKFMNYLNGSVGAVMFFNMRSAILQQMSIVNYINFADNNPLAAAKAFANQKQYWADFAFIFNSDMLKQRRGGIGTDINGAELAEAINKAGAKGVVNQTKVVIAKLLKLGFLPTQIGDNIAIATGGATFYRNRVNKYIKEGLSKKEAESKAFTDFQDITQSTQQSSRPDMTSQQQRSWIGKLVLNFQNITSQYNRIIKKSASDIYNRRMTPPYKNQFQSDASNMSRILYYGAIQNVIFYALQTALFAVMFGSDNEEDEKFLQKGERVVNGTFDSILRGSGIYGVAVSTLKNMAIKYHEQRDKKYNPDESAVLMEALNFSPVVGIKARKIVNAEKTINYNENVINEMKALDADNPGWSAATNYIEALTNFPANRLYQKSINIRNSLNNDYEAWQRALFFSGYTTWSLGLDDTKKMQEIKKNVRLKKQKEAEERAKIKREENKRKKQKEQEAQIKENIKKSKKDNRCAAINSSGERCSNKAIAGGFCTIHEKKEQRTDGKQVQCSAKKSDGTRCKMQTTNKSGKCYYHD